MKFHVNMLSRCTLVLVTLAGAAQAQTRPAIAESPIARPKTIMYVGNSFFYYNNSMHSQVLALR